MGVAHVLALDLVATRYKNGTAGYIATPKKKAHYRFDSGLSLIYLAERVSAGIELHNISRRI